jgi:hypothetical protein
MLAGTPFEQQRSRSDLGQFSGTTNAERRKFADPGDPGVTCRTPCQGCWWGPRGCFLAGASRAGDLWSPHSMDSLTIHGAPLSTSRGPGRVREDTALTDDPGTRPPWAEADRAHAGSAGTMTRAAVIAPRPREGRGGASAGRGIRLSSSSASRWRCTVCTPSSTAGDGTGVRGHRCAGIETQPKRAPLTRQRTRARIGTAAWRRSGGPSPGCWTSIVAHNCAEMVARW